jgi:MFS family permease
MPKSSLTLTWLAQMSDRYGRTRIICTSVLGILFDDLAFLAVSRYASILPGGYWFLAVGSFLSGISGGRFILLPVRTRAQPVCHQELSQRLSP